MRDVRVVEPVEGYERELGAALWALRDGRERTLRLLADLPADELDAEVDGNSIGSILYHLALIEVDWLFEEILQEPFPAGVEALLPFDDRDEAGLLTVVRGQSLQEHLARLAAVRELLERRLRGMSEHEFSRPRQLPDYDVSPAWVLHHLAQHEAEHRGEIGSVSTALRRRS